MASKRIVQTTAVTLLAVAAAAAVGVLLVRDQISRHRSDTASVDAILLLRDFLAWEPRPLLRRRAAAVLAQLEESLSARSAPEVA